VPGIFCDHSDLLLIEYNATVMAEHGRIQNDERKKKLKKKKLYNACKPTNNRDLKSKIKQATPAQVT